MLTSTDYCKLWANDFAPHTALPIPSYIDYQVSERMLEDYIDIFRGKNTRVNENFEMPYPHPFFDEKGNPLLKDKPCIKYIMIAEARPAPNPPKWKNFTPLAGDEANTFFYNIQHVKNTAYLSAPQTVWGCPNFTPCPTDKIKTLLCLASEGVLLLDLFPFAINFSSKIKKKSLRELICDKVKFFWDCKSNKYSVRNRIGEISNLLCKDDVKLAFIAPPIISYCIAEGINNRHNGWPTFGCNHRQGHNTFNPECRNIRGKFYASIPLKTILIGENGNYYHLPLGNNKTHSIQVPIYACCCYSGSNLVPHELFIRNAFGLPSNQNQI